MELKLLNKEELARLFEEEMVIDFPKSELKPLSAMYRLMDLGLYEPLRVLQDGQPVGYALAWLPAGRQGALLDYFGVSRDKRDAGLGSAVLAMLVERYGCIFGEVEAPVDPDPEVNELRRRRIGFYLRNGLRQLDYDCALFGVHYNCLYLGPETDDRKIETMHRAVYSDYYSSEHFARFVQLPLLPGEEINALTDWVDEWIEAEDLKI